MSMNLLASLSSTPTIGQLLSSRDNALNFVRLCLASLVIVAHTELSGLEQIPLTYTLGSLAVGGFFTISGFLIAGSRMNGNLTGFIWRRCVRIFPAFWGCLILTAFVFAPLLAFLEAERISWASAGSYVYSNLALWMTQGSIEETLTDAPYGPVWNGSLWTLFYEFCAYLAAGTLLSVAFIRKKPVFVLAAAFVGMTVLFQLADGLLSIDNDLFRNAVNLGIYFLAGMLFWSIRENTPSTWKIAVPCLLLVVVIYLLVPSGVPLNLAALPLAYVMLWLGGFLRTRIGAKNDYSYGVYVYAFPIQQMLAATGLAAMMGNYIYALVTWVLTFPLAVASWHYVEKPALKFSRLLDSSKLANVDR